jgi:anti-sigma B factor antagonist
MIKPTNFEIRQSAQGPAGKLEVLGELDMRTTDQLTQSLNELLAHGATDVTIDLSQLSFMDSSGLRLLIEANNRSREETWQFQLIAPQQEAAALVLQVTGADKALPFKEASGP